MDFELNNKSVIITGGASNIGRAIVLGLAGEGANITIGDIDEENAEKVVAEAKQLGAGNAQAILTDVAQMDQVQNLVQAAVDHYGTVDVLINNVGWDELMYFTQTTPEFWQKVIQLNFLGVLNCTKTVLEIMIEKQKGAIVSISSDASRQGEPKEAVYGGMKAAVNSFMKTIARENGRFGIRCNTVCPGVTIPESDQEVGKFSLWSDKDSMFTEDQISKISNTLPLRKINRAKDIANAVLFLASDAMARTITGQVLSVSGGYTMIG